jgi:hypothetical protein
MARTVVMLHLDGTLTDTAPQVTEFLAWVYQESSEYLKRRHAST